MGFEQGICSDNELSHDGGNGDLGRLSGCDELLVFGRQVWIEVGGDQGWHVECLVNVGPATADVFFKVIE